MLVFIFTFKLVLVHGLRGNIVNLASIFVFRRINNWLYNENTAEHTFVKDRMQSVGSAAFGWNSWAGVC